MTFLSEKLERLEHRNLTRKRRISKLAWSHAIQILAERIEEVDRLATEALPHSEEPTVMRRQRSIALRLSAKLSEVRERVESLTDRLKAMGKDSERKQLADPFIRQIRAARAAELEAEQQWKLATTGVAPSATSMTTPAYSAVHTDSIATPIDVPRFERPAGDAMVRPKGTRPPSVNAWPGG